MLKKGNVSTNIQLMKTYCEGNKMETFNMNTYQGKSNYRLTICCKNVVVQYVNEGHCDCQKIQLKVSNDATVFRVSHKWFKSKVCFR